MNAIELVGSYKLFFIENIESHVEQLNSIVINSTFLVLGVVDTIGQAVIKEIFKRNSLGLNLAVYSLNEQAEIVNYDQ